MYFTGIIVVDASGKIGAGTTTNGLTYKIPGCVQILYCKNDIVIIDESGIPPLWELAHMQIMKWEGLSVLEMVM